MATIAIVCQRAFGHVVPAAGLGAELRSRGHDVLLITHPSHAALAAKAGLRFAPARWGMFPELFIQELMEELLAIMAGQPIDLIINDSSQAAPAYAAEVLNIPWVSFQTNIPLTDEEMPGGILVNNRLRETYRNKLNAIRMHYELPLIEQASPRTRGDLAGLSSLLHLIMVAPDLCFSQTKQPPHHVIVGPCTLETGQAAPFPLTRNKSPVIVICTSSSRHHAFRSIVRRYVQTAVRALSTLPFKVIVSGSREELYPGDHSSAEWAGDKLSHDCLLQHADLVVTHGSCGTIQRVMKHGLPMIIVPLGMDHSILAQQCERLGVGIMLEEDRLTGSSFLEAVQALCSNRLYEERAGMAASRLGRLNPNRHAGNCVETLLQRGSVSHD